MNGAESKIVIYLLTIYQRAGINPGFVTKISSSETYSLFAGANNLGGEAQIYGYVKTYIQIFIQCNEHYIKCMGRIPWKQGEVTVNSAGWGTSLFWLHMDTNSGAGL